MRRRYLVMMLAALLAVSACRTAPDTAEDEELAERPRVEETERGVPEFRDIEFIDDDLQVVDLGEAGGVQAFRVGNLKVLHMPTPANEVVAARLYIRGGVATLSEELAGIEQLALAVAVNGGTESTSKDEFNTRLDAVGSSIGYIADRDYSGVTMNSVRDHFETTWALFEEAIFEPAFPEDEVELRRNRQLASIDSLTDDPDRLVNEVARDVTFAGHPYAIRELGTRESVSELSRDELRAWQRSLLSPERMLLVVVGNVERDLLIEKVQNRLGRIAASGQDAPAMPPVEFEAPALRVEQMSLPTNYILGYFPAPNMGEEDYAAMILATRHLRGRLFEEVRTRRNLTYAVSAGIGNRAANVGFLYVTAVDPAATMPVIFAEVERLQQEPITETELEEVRNVFLTSHYMGLETNAGVAGQLAAAELIGGDWSKTTRFLDAVNAVTPDDVQRVAQAYIRDVQFGVVGDPAQVPGALFGVEDDAVEEVDEFDDPDGVASTE